MLRAVSGGGSGGGPTTNPVSRAQGGSGQTTGAETYRGTYNVTDYGALGNGIYITGIATTAGSNQYTATSYTFQPSDVGKMISFLSLGTYVVNTTITAVSGGVATTGYTAGGTTTYTGYMGTDDTAAIQAAINAAGANLDNVGSLVILNAAIYITTAPLVWLNKVSMSGQGMLKSLIYWASPTALTGSSPIISGLAGSASVRYTDCAFADFSLDGRSMNVSTYAVGQKGFYMQYLERCFFNRVQVMNIPASGFGVDYLTNCVLDQCHAKNCGRSAIIASSIGGAGIGIGTGASYAAQNVVECSTVVNCYAENNRTFGIFFETQSTISADVYHRVLNNTVVMSATSGRGIGDEGNTNMEIIGNHIRGTTGCGDGIAAVKSNLGAPGGVRGNISNNVITGCPNAITIDYTTQSSTSNRCDYTIQGNKITLSTVAGINIVTNATKVMDTLFINGNEVDLSAAAGITFSGAAGAQDVNLVGNTFKNNGTASGSAATLAGISIGTAITRLRMVGNFCFDSQATKTQQYGVIFNGSALTDCYVVDNDFSNNATGAFSYLSSAAAGGFFQNNKGNLETFVSDAAYTVIPSDETVSYSSLTATRAVALSVASSCAGKRFLIKDEAGTAGTNALTFAASIDGATGKSISTNYGFLRIYSNGSAYFTW